MYINFIATYENMYGQRHKYIYVNKSSKICTHHYVTDNKVGVYTFTVY
jgi:hypothetical protein